MKIKSLVRAALIIGLAVCVSSAWAKPTNRWRIHVNHSADSDGVMIFQVTRIDGEAYTVNAAIEDGTGENRVAKDLVKAFRAQLPDDQFKIERDDGEDVLVKVRMGEPDFELELTSSTVEGVDLKVKHD